MHASLALIATGVGFLKTNASTLVGALSERDDPRRDAGFTLFYMGYNTGGVIAPLVCVIGHARSTIGDTIYAHTVESALAGVSERVADRVGLTLPKPPAAPDPPNAPRQPPKLRMIDGGRRREGIDQRDIRQTMIQKDSNPRPPA